MAEKAKIILKKAKQVSPMHNTAVESVKHTLPSQSVSNQNCDTLSLKHLSILLCNWRELLAEGEGERRVGGGRGISELWETIGLPFSFYNGAERNKET